MKKFKRTLYKTGVFDFEDLYYVPTNTPLRQNVDLRNFASPIEEQLSIGSCSAQAVIGAYELLTNRDYPTQFKDLSRMFVYYNTRLLDNTENEDIGATVRDTIKSLKTNGVCSEELWPYSEDILFTRPSDLAYADARSRTIINYGKISRVDDMLDALNNNSPIVTGTRLYSPFDNLNKDNAILKKTFDPVGDHAVCVVGYDLETKMFLVRNSYGPKWGIDGYCWAPFDYAQSEWMDSWTFDIELL